MAVNYTQLFTVAGCYVDKIQDYYAYIATFTSNKASVEAILTAQSLIRLNDDLDENFDSFKEDVSAWIAKLVSHVETLFTDETLIGANFAFGQSPDLSVVWPALIHDMATNDKNVVANVITVGTVTYAATNTLYGKLAVGTMLDGFSPPIANGPAIMDYAGLTSQMTPDSETLAFTCVSDSEGATERGGEVFAITGTGPTSEPYSPSAESVGSLGTMVVADVGASAYGTNFSFDGWDNDTTDVPDGWTLVDGTVVTHFAEDATNTLYGEGSALRIIGGAGGEEVTLTQVLSESLFPRKRAFWLSCWARKLIDTLADAEITLSITDDNFSYPITVQPTSTAWVNYSAQFLLPIEVEGDITLTLTTGGGGLDSTTHNAVVIDQIVITPCEYHAGISPVIFGGPEKWLVGDKIYFTLANNVAGKFQTFFRKAFGVQLPTDATPTISDALVT